MIGNMIGNIDVSGDGGKLVYYKKECASKVHVLSHSRQDFRHARFKSHLTVPHPGIGTGISEASKRVPIFPFDTQGGKQASSYFRQRNWVQAREAQIRFPAG